ncbi:putative integral membrane protein [Companilactobacillus kimchii DSM 13961 = JCM 10707]|uniref:Integral membrane protein n=2 Tax=Companilactobacillus kimchii TaxID=2801452 RepID=A0ABR5NXA4_9LACO|nr:putative integral membrane protein [Companilactobacillus kimchii DSM 13961 = JCM 10707]
MINFLGGYKYMQRYKTRYELKTEVKSLLQGNWTRAIQLYLIPVIVMIININVSRSNSTDAMKDAVYNNGGAFSSLLSTSLTSYIISLVVLLISLSSAFRGLDWIEDPQLDFQPIKSNFTYFRSPDWWKLILIYILVGIFTFLWTLLLVIPGIIKMMAYSQTYFIYKDLNDRGEADGLSLTDYITRSRRLMVGNKGRYFMLQLSFLGWWILGSITLGIGFIWIYPYYKLTMANFYQDLVDKNAANDIR